MRLLLFVILASGFAWGCDGKPLTGPEAQRVVAKAKSAHLNFDSGPVILIDGVRANSQEEFQKLDPNMIESVEILKNGIASHSYSSQDRVRGLIIIKTKRAPPSQRPQ